MCIYDNTDIFNIFIIFRLGNHFKLFMIFPGRLFEIVDVLDVFFGLFSYGAATPIADLQARGTSNIHHGCLPSPDQGDSYHHVPKYWVFWKLMQETPVKHVLWKRAMNSGSTAICIPKKESFQHDQPFQFTELLYRWMILKRYHLCMYLCTL